MKTHNIETLTENDIYNICILVNAGWKKDSDGYWIHPSGKTTVRVRSQWVGDCDEFISSDENKWELEEAVDEESDCIY